MKLPLVKVRKLGLIRYADALKIQLGLAEDIAKRNADNVLLILEHNPVYTTGIRPHENHSENEEKRLRNLGADFHRTKRGGLITFHGPGQMVAYPILDLTRFELPAKSSRKAIFSAKCYVDMLEQVVIDTCREGFGLTEAKRSPHTGVWIGEEDKICAMGIRNSGFVTTHGLALNCNTDLRWFGQIVPCGIEGKGVTSLSRELGRDVSVEETVPIFLEQFENTFRCQLVQEE